MLWGHLLKVQAHKVACRDRDDALQVDTVMDELNLTRVRPCVGSFHA